MWLAFLQILKFKLLLLTTNQNTVTMSRILPLLVAVFMIGFYACDDHSDYDPVNFDNLEGSCDHVFLDSVGTEFHVGDTAAYDTLITPFCNTRLPDADSINFDENHLIGKHIEAEACSVGYNRQMTQNVHSGTYNVHIEVREFGDCRAKHESMNFMRVNEDMGRNPRIQYNIRRVESQQD